MHKQKNSPSLQVCVLINLERGGRRGERRHFTISRERELLERGRESDEEEEEEFLALVSGLQSNRWFLIVSLLGLFLSISLCSALRICCFRGFCFWGCDFSAPYFLFFIFYLFIFFFANCFWSAWLPFSGTYYCCRCKIFLPSFSFTFFIPKG